MNHDSGGGRVGCFDERERCCLVTAHVLLCDRLDRGAAKALVVEGSDAISRVDKRRCCLITGRVLLGDRLHCGAVNTSVMERSRCHYSCQHASCASSNVVTAGLV